MEGMANNERRPHLRAVPEFTRGDRLRKALAVAGVSNDEMAEYLGVTRNTIGNYIAERTHVSEGTLRLWAFRTGVPLEWLRNGPSKPLDGPVRVGGAMG